jgi:SAM-dependent methyltransferase
MSDSDASYGYGSGIGEDEVARLEAQSRVLARPTRMIFAEAGIRPGMRVLDLGCGAGDATFVAADLVGPGCVTPAPRRRSIPTATSGLTWTSRPAPPSMPSSLPGRNSGGTAMRP